MNSNVGEEWYWLVSDCNPAVRGTRTAATLKDLGAGSDYQEGKGWMRRPVRMALQENIWTSTYGRNALGYNSCSSTASATKRGCPLLKI
jgi:hypothetical protein